MLFRKNLESFWEIVYRLKICKRETGARLIRTMRFFEINEYECDLKKNNNNNKHITGLKHTSMKRSFYILSVLIDTNELAYQSLHKSLFPRLF